MNEQKEVSIVLLVVNVGRTVLMRCDLLSLVLHVDYMSYHPWFRRVAIVWALVLRLFESHMQIS